MNTKCYVYFLAKKQHLGTNTLWFMATQDKPKLIIIGKRFEPISQKQRGCYLLPRHTKSLIRKTQRKQHIEHNEPLTVC